MRKKNEEMCGVREILRLEKKKRKKKEICMGVSMGEIWHEKKKGIYIWVRERGTLRGERKRETCMGEREIKMRKKVDRHGWERKLMKKNSVNFPNFPAT